MSNQEQSLTKVAFARGVTAYMQEAGYTGFASLDHVKEAAALAVANVAFPDPAHETPTAADYQKVAGYIHALWQHFAPGKVASQQPRRAIFGDDHMAAYGDLFKEAMDGYSPGMSGLIAETPVPVNGPATTATPMGQIDAARRPPEYAMGPPGSANLTDVPTSATVGVEMPHPQQESIPSGGVQNSLTAVSEVKAAQARFQYLNALKAAMDGGYSPGMSGPVAGTTTPANTPAQASTPMSEIDAARRPEGYAVGPAGSAGLQDVPAAARTGVEMPHPHQEAIPSGGVSNSVTDASKVAEVVRGLFPRASAVDQVKIAAAVMNYPPDQRMGALVFLQNGK